jgi:hypothetical protein
VNFARISCKIISVYVPAEIDDNVDEALNVPGEFRSLKVFEDDSVSLGIILQRKDI